MALHTFLRVPVALIGLAATPSPAPAAVASTSSLVQLQQVLTPFDGVLSDGFGQSVAIEGDTAVAGSHRDRIGSNSAQGSAYVFVRSGTTWSLQAKLTAFDGQAEDHLGTAVAISGDTVVVGASSATVGTDLGRGAVYVFTRSGGAWTLQARLLADDGGPSHSFGTAVAIEGDTVVVGAPQQNLNQGATYVFVRSAGAWSQEAKLLAGDGVAGQRFGAAVGLSGDTVAIGANGTEQLRGAVYVFTRQGTTWAQQEKLLASDRQPGDRLGYSVAIGPDTVGAGAVGASSGTIQKHGAAYVFTRQGTSWTEMQKLTASDAAAFDGFGGAIALSGDTVAVGEQAEGGTPTNRAVYTFERSASQWTQQQKLVSGTGAADGYARSVGMAPGGLIVGAPGNGTPDAAYVYADSTSNTAPTLVPDGPLTREQGVAPAAAVVATVSDAEDAAGDLTVTATPPPGIGLPGLTNTDGTVTALVGAECAAPVGTAAVPLTVTDTGGLTASDTLLVDVTANATPPSISCGPDVAVTAAPAECSAAVDFALPAASDDCPGSTVACAPAPGSVFSAGATTVTCTAMDAAGNTAACPVTVTVTPSLALSPQEQGFAAGGGTGTVNVTAAAGCAWTAVSSDAWITVTSGASGEGNGTVGYAVAAHTGGGARTGTLAIAGRTFTVTQQAGCPFAIAPTAADFPIGGGDGSLSVTTQDGCAWTAASNDAWITLTSGAAGTGSGAVGFAVEPYNGPPRAGSITVAGLTFTVTQTCAFSLGETSFSGQALGFRGLVLVEANLPQCAWSAVSNVPWVHLQPGGPGRGTGVVVYDVEPSPSTAQRSGTLTLAGLTFTVHQDGCERHLHETSAFGPARDFRGDVAVLANTPACAWTAVSNTPWIHIQPGLPAGGTATVIYDVEANASTAPRTGTLTVADETFTLHQDGCERHLRETSVSGPARDFRGSVNVLADTPQCAWTAVSNAPWIHIQPGWPGSGTGAVIFDVEPNASTTPRTGTLTVADEAFTVMQDGNCTFSLSGTSDAFTPAGGEGRVRVTAESGCSWTAVSDSDWITITSGAAGTGSGRVTYAVAAHAGPTPRTGTLTIGLWTFTVTQSACEFSLAPQFQGFPPSGGTERVRVRTSSTCTWTAASNDAWIRVTSASGPGNGQVEYSVAAHTGSATRTGSLTVAGQTFTVSQSGCEVLLHPPFEEFFPAGGAGRVSVSTFSGCGWRAVSNDAWIQVTVNPTGSGNDRVEYVVAPHAGALARTGTITIGGQTFTVIQQGSCGYAVAPAVQDFTPAGGTGSLAVTASSGCAWTAASSEGWITLTSGGSGTGDGVVSYSVGPSVGTPRSGTVTVGGRAGATINQGCGFRLSPDSVNVGSGSANATLDLFTNGSECAWSADSDVPWISLGSLRGGRGSRSIHLQVAANPLTTGRTGTVTIAGQTFTVVQAGCSLRVDPPFVNVGPELSQETLWVDADNDVCPWTAQGNVPWITFPFGSSGTGRGPLPYVVGPNLMTLPRTGRITLGGRAIVVTQDGQCTYALPFYFTHVTARGGEIWVPVLTGRTCSWTAASNDPWISVNRANGTGERFVRVRVSRHTGSAQRNGTATIAGLTFEVIQAGTGN